MLDKYHQSPRLFGRIFGFVWIVFRFGSVAAPSVAGVERVVPAAAVVVIVVAVASFGAEVDVAAVVVVAVVFVCVGLA